MCLRIKYGRKSHRKTGYKLLHTRTHGGFETGQCNAGRVVIGSKVYATDPNEYDIRGAETSYPAGFHIFLSRKAAERVKRLDSSTVVLCKVRFKDEVAYGKVRWIFCAELFYTATVVARKCKVIEIISGN